MFKLKQAHSDSGSGLGYQIGSYIMMRALEKRTGLKWGVDKNQFLALRHTFKDLPIHVIKEPKDIIRDSSIDYKTVAFDDEYGFNSIAEKLQDDTIIDTYPTVRNFVPSGDNGDLFLECKNELVFRDDIVEKCQKFIEPFGKDVIAMHVRRGDFKNPQNGMFVCGTDYYENALAELPDNIPVLIFTNDKDSVIRDTSLISKDPSRFTFITDLYNDNELIDCDLGQELDRRVDISGECLFEYKTALSKIVKEEISQYLDDERLIQEMSKKIRELHPKYKSKIKSNIYNHSLDFCLMTMCNHYVMANSTYGLWAVELGRPIKEWTSVIYPMYWLQGHVGTEQVLQAIKSDLGDFNQTGYFAASLVDRPFYKPMANPDPRAFEVI
tara:strand:- start:1523 stop:2668 length:1146 start_codon:yes stop_codon:yes gene_type:complete